MFVALWRQPIRRDEETELKRLVDHVVHLNTGCWSSLLVRCWEIEEPLVKDIECFLPLTWRIGVHLENYVKPSLAEEEACALPSCSTMAERTRLIFHG